MKKFFLLTLALMSLALHIPAVAQEQVVIEVDLNKTKGPMKPVWAWFGYDEPNYTYMKDGRKLLGEISALSYTPVYVRMHNLLTTGDGTAALKWGSTNAYTEDEAGNPVYDWTITDRIFDQLVSKGMKPLVEIGFMPQALSAKPEPYQHTWSPADPYGNIFTGWAHPPKDYEKWSELVFQWAKHCRERYGDNEVLSWYWEVWNEPNIGYWQGTFEEYCKLYDYAAQGLRRAIPQALIGGPHSTDPTDPKAAEFLRKFLEHCLRGTNYATGKKGSPLDYVGFHAKGAPSVVEGHVRMNIGRQLANINRGFEIVASFPELKNTPIIIGESDPEGCAACSIDHHPQNAYRNGTMFSSYTAAAFARKYELAARHGVNFLGAVSWAFEFEDQKWFAGFRDLATNGVDKPVLNVFRMFGMMRGELAEATSSAGYDAAGIVARSVRQGADVGVLASREPGSAAIMIWNYHDHDLPAEDTPVALYIGGLGAATVNVAHYRIDSRHSNSYELWKEMGSPQNPTPEQYEKLEKGGKLEMLDQPVRHNTTGGGLNLEFDLPRQGVSLLKISW